MTGPVGWPGPGIPDEDATTVIARIGSESLRGLSDSQSDPGRDYGAPTTRIPAVPTAAVPTVTATPAPPDTPGAASVGMRTARTSGVVRAGSAMAIATLVSRGTGFVAKVVLLAFLGFWVVNDSYNLANTLPNIVFELLIGGVLTSVAIPLLSRARSDPDGGTAYTQRLMSLAIVALLLATGAAMAAAPLLTRLYLSGDHSDPVLATHLAYLLLPQIFFYGIAALFGAILNTKERFAAPAWAPVINNLVVIAVGVTLLVLPSPTAPRHGLASLSDTQFLLLGGGTTVGIVAQALVLLPALRRSGFRFRWRWGLDARMGEAGRLMAWAIAYTLISQAGYVITARVAFASQDGLYGLYNYGSMLFQLPYGILGVSLLTAIMPRMSRHAAAGEMDAVKHDMGVANRLSTVALLPVTAAMIALAAPLATITAQYGRVTESATHILGLTLAAFAIGLLPLAVTLVQMRVFYAMKDGRTPTLINLIMVAVRIPLLEACRALPQEWVVPGLALAMSVSYLVGVVVGEVWLRVRFGPMGSGRTVRTVGKVALASAVGGLAAWAVVEYLLPVTGGSLAQAVLQLIVGGLMGLVVAGAILMLLRVDEVAALRRRLGRRGRPGTVASDRLISGPGGDGNAAGHGTLVGATPTARGTGRYRGEYPDGYPDRYPDRGQVAVTEQRGDAGSGPATPASGMGADATVRVPPVPAATPDSGATTRVPSPQVTDPDGTTPHARAVAANAAPAAFAPGTVIGERYRLVSLIATDGAGNRFWRARDTVLPRDMAVTLMPDLPHTAATVARTLRAGRLHHIGLPQTLDVGTIDSGSGAAYVVGQWVDGATLADLLTGGPLDPEVATSLTTKVADAVAEAHRNGIALGALHPSLVRVNFDGQLRLSHVIAHAGATTDADIRAVGALLYLMLTGRWPLAAADGSPQLSPAPTRGGREIPAAEVNPDIPVALSALAERALHPDDPQGIHAIGAITALLRPARPPAPSGTGVAGPPQEPQGRVLGPAERALIRERRIKLSIGGGMLTALAVLIVIVVASLINNLMTSIVEPIKASDQQQQLLDVTTPTTTRTVGTSPTGAETERNTSTPTGTSTGPSQTSAPSTKSTTSGPSAAPIKVAGATVYDPQGTPPKDYESSVDRAYDGDPATYWMTWVYKQQFGRAQGGLKDGVGLLLSFATPVSPSSVTVSTGTPGTNVEIRSAAGPSPSLDATTVLGSATLGTDPVSITLSNTPKSKYLLVWITKLAPYQGDSAQNQGQFQSSITEVTVSGS